MKVTFVKKSGNEKTGNIPVSYSERSTCPDTCAWFKKGCYGLCGNCRIHWQRVNGTWQNLCKNVAEMPKDQVWRHNVVGDLPGKNRNIDSKKVAQLVKANDNRPGYTYTHKPTLATKYAEHNKKVIAQANKDGFTINLSGDNPKHADQLVDLGIGPVTLVLPVGSPDLMYTPKGNKVVKCPAQSRENVTCKTCKLCAKADRKVIIGFEAHGAAAKTVSEKSKG